MLSIHSTSVELEGVHTDIMIQGFADRILVLVTQMGKVGNLIQASIPLTTPLLSAQEDSLLPSPPAAIQLTPLLGEAKKMAVDRRSVVVGIALRDADERKTFHGVMDYIGRLIRE
ncbi:hypothetical protein EDD22DRAFT_860008 [Suillus occidentalis]|nr:hypothetical protein EDD22DRAFT_860008 [Suillus occidentalis]